jgi:YHS domain-containing protein
MVQFNLSTKILTIILLVTSIVIFAQRARACSSCDSYGMMLSQNDQNMNNMNMNNMNTNNDEMKPVEMIKKGYALSPVSHTEVKITENTPFTVYGDRKYYFASEQEKQEFLQDPGKYINSMLPEKGNKPPVSHENKGL